MESRIQNSIKTILANMVLQVTTVLFSFISRSAFIYKLGEGYLGINGLFSNVLGLLSLAELGIGTAITFYMYKPAAENDKERLRSLMHLYKTCYHIVGTAILTLGLFLLPILPRLVNFDTDLNINLYYVYFLYLLNSVLSYFMFAYRISLFMGYQQMYKVVGIQTTIKIITTGMITIGLLITGDFFVYLFLHIVSTLLNNLAIGMLAEKQFPFIKEKLYIKLEDEEIKKILKNVYAVFIFNIGNQLLLSTDNILISLICGTAVVGYYSNYSLIITSVTTFYNAVMNSILPSIGNLNTGVDTRKQLKVLYNLNFLNFWMVTFCAISLMMLTNPFIFLWTKKIGNTNYVLPETIPMLLGVNFWLLWYMQVVGQFRNTKGLFWHGKYIQMIMGAVNLLLSIFFGYMWRLTGIISATTISMVFISSIPFPYYLFKYGYGISSKPFLKICIKDFMVLWMIYGIIKILCVWIDHVSIFTFLYKALLCIIVTNLVIFMIYKDSSGMKYAKMVFLRFMPLKGHSIID